MANSCDEGETSWNGHRDEFEGWMATGSEGEHHVSIESHRIAAKVTPALIRMLELTGRDRVPCGRSKGQLFLSVATH